VSLGSNSGRLNLEILSGELVHLMPWLRIANADKTTAVSTATYGILNENTSAAE
jgi:hypothetical protein